MTPKHRHSQTAASHLVHVVHVHPVLKQQLDDFPVTVATGQQESVLPVVSVEVDVGLAVDEELDGGHLTVRTRPVESGQPLLVRLVHITAWDGNRIG